MNEKYNVIMPETTDSCLCIQIERQISVEGYKENFVKRIEAQIAKFGEVRLLVYYKKFSGWDKEAAMTDVSTNARFTGKLCKMAMVNAPESEATRGLVRQESLKGKLILFKEEDLQKAIEWVKS